MKKKNYTTFHHHIWPKNGVFKIWDFSPPIPGFLTGVATHSRIVVKEYQKILQTFDTVYHICLIQAFKEYAWNWNLRMNFWATSKTGQPLRPFGSTFLALFSSALKRSLWDINFFYTFENPWSSGQMLVSLCEVFLNTRDTRCTAAIWAWGHKVCTLPRTRKMTQPMTHLPWKMLMSSPSTASQSTLLQTTWGA